MSASNTPLAYLAEAVPNVLNSTWRFRETEFFPFAVAASIHSIASSYKTRKVFQSAGRSNFASEFFVQFIYGFGGLDAIVTGYGIANGVDLIKSMPDKALSHSIVGMLTIGTAMGCGGGAIAGFLMLAKPPQMRTANLGNLPGLSIKVCSITSVLYIAATRSWSFSDAAPNFMFSALLDNIIHAIIPHLTDAEARLVVATSFASVTSYLTYKDATTVCPSSAIKSQKKSSSPSAKSQKSKNE
ncbi:hypothetical protein BB560_005364 [Smittium megazygosporum]|uniref:Uncharacterized protein n=1 Tax=Smittium megazygosporum TaxID=133381 RepID=A0A2T9Z6U2_9FUNG|nr:hypothetical protein BB560_005364 [Smittium megazygosporum]